MDTVTILRELWRLRRYVAIVCIFALLAAAAIEFKLPSLQTRKYQVGVATTNILVDTPSSQVVDLTPKGSETTAGRADLLASLMIDGTIKSTIAQLAGLHPNQIIGVTGAATAPSAGSGSGTLPSGPQAYVLTTQVLTNSEGNELPIIEVSIQAPTADAAAKLASAAVTGLGQYLNSKAADERIPGGDRLQVEGLGTPQATFQARGPSNMIALIIFAVLFVLGCAAILGIQALVRGWRAASAGEGLRDDQPAPLEVVRAIQDGQVMEAVSPMDELRPRLVPSAPEPVIRSASDTNGHDAPEPQDHRAWVGHGISTDKDSFRRALRGER